MVILSLAFLNLDLSYIIILLEIHVVGCKYKIHDKGKG